LTVGILRGEFAKFREPSDRVEEQGSYGLKSLYQDSRGCERRSREIVKESEPSDWKDTCHKILSIRDSDIGGQRGKFFDFTSGEVAKESKPSTGGGQVAEIKGSRKLGGSQGESPKIGCSKSRVVKSRGARTAIGSRSSEDHWIRVSPRLSRIRRFEGAEEPDST
jgi:hypothetical protein